MTHTANRLVALIAEHADRSPDSIGPMMKLWPDLDLDSLDRIDLGLRIEQEFGIDITDSELQSDELGTVGGLLAMVVDKAGDNQVWATEYSRPLPSFRSEPVFRGDSTRGRHEVSQQLRAAFDAGLLAGRCDPNPEAAWQAFKGSIGL